MNKIELGRTGLKVSQIGLGCAPFGFVNRANGWDPYTESGAAEVLRTINAALDQGINYIDTAPRYGTGHSELLVGEVMKTRRPDCILASKVDQDLGRTQVIESVHDSLRRLKTDYIDVMQLHGVMFSADDYQKVINGGALDALRELRDQGKIGHIGITADEPWTLIPFLSHKDISVYQIAYNIIYQAAARHFLVEAKKAEVGVVTMRTMTSGILQHQIALLAPEWQKAHDLYDVCLKFVLSDSRVHSGLIGMRWAHEIEQNVKLLEGWSPPVDLAEMPRLGVALYKAQDAELGL